MEIRKKELWKVPVFCVIAGYVTFYLVVYALTAFVMERQPDGSVFVHQTRELIIYCLQFLLPFLFGGLVCFRNMTRREIFCSASIVAVYGVALILAQGVFHLTSGTAGLWVLYLFRPFQWCSVVAQIFHDVFGNPWLSSLAQVLSVYLFVIFGSQNHAENTLG